MPSFALIPSLEAASLTLGGLLLHRSTLLNRLFDGSHHVEGLFRQIIVFAVENLEEAIEYYTRLFGVGPNKRKPGYANFAIDRPALKLVLFEARAPPNA